MKQENGTKKDRMAERISDALDELEDTMLSDVLQKRQEALERQEQQTGEEKVIRRENGESRQEETYPRVGGYTKNWWRYGSLAACVALLVVTIRIVPAIWPSGQTTLPDLTSGNTTSPETNSSAGDFAKADTPDSEAAGAENGSLGQEGLPEEGNTSDHAAESQGTGTEAEDKAAENSMAVNQEAYGFTLGDNIVYFPISFDDRIRYGLLRKGAEDQPQDNLPQENSLQNNQAEDGFWGSNQKIKTQKKNTATEEAAEKKVPEKNTIKKNAIEEALKPEEEATADPAGWGLTPENTYQITKQDLGEVMGTVQSSADQSLIGCTVYHFAEFPELDSICILEQEGSYAFYTADGLWLSEEPGQSFDRVIEAYGLPESVTKLEVEDRQGGELFEITDPESIASLCTLLSGKTDIGMQANNERYARLWQDTYGNEEVSYDGESFSYSDQVDYDAVHEFWHSNQRVVWVTTSRGFRFLLQYNPSVRTVECYGYYELTEEEVTKLNRVFGVEVK